MLRIAFAIVSFLSFSVVHAHAEADAPMTQSLEKPDRQGGEMSMNGYTLKQFGDFVHQWHFVTVRFRRDSGEMRFVYANDIAWKALQEGSKDYPDGAVFTKVAVMTGEDPAFTDSAVPQRPDRVQIMVRDHKKHKDTSGWGYAMFNIRGFVGPGKPIDEMSKACDACHQAVPERGMVFAQIMPDISPAHFDANFGPKIGNISPAQISFVTVKFSDLPAAIRAKLPPSTISVRSMQGAITEHMFQGSMHESIPFVGAEAASSGMPAVIISKKNSKEFSAIWPVKDNGDCNFPGGMPSHMVQGIFYAVFKGEGIIPSRMDYAQIQPFCAPVIMSTPLKP